MSDALSDAQISLLCDIGQANHYETPDDKKPDIAFLVEAGYVTVVNERARPTLQLTEKASTLLSARGATLNEA